MKYIKINGGKPLQGEISIGGAKNSAVALIPAALLANSKCRIEKIPDISDKDALFDILKVLNVDFKFNDKEVIIDPTNLKNVLIPEDLSNKLRASYYFMGVLLAKFKKVEIFFPGGCNIGQRPIDLHLKGFEALGAKISHDEDTHKYTLEAKNLKGTRINLDFASVGATINIMFAASMAEGITTISNAAKEIEIINIAQFLNKMGAKIEGAGTSVITIEGVKKLNGANIDVIPDRIEAGTYLMIGSLLGKNLVIEGVLKDHLEAVFTKLKEAGCDINIDGTTVIVNKVDHLKPVNVKTLVYPGFPTDLGQPMSTLLTQCEGESLFEETIYENRMRHIKYLNAMGANIRLFDRSAIIAGKSNLIGREVEATDLRAGAAMLVAGMIAEGTTKIVNIEHILRGYEKIVEKLSTVGAKIELVDE